VVVVLLVGLAVWLADSQTTSREAVETRFADGARVTSALTEALLTSSAASSREANAVYASGEVSDRRLDALAARSRLDYAVLLDANGRILASSRGLTRAAVDRIVRRPAPIRAALTGTPFTLSDVLRTGPRGGPVVEFAAAIPGGRVIVSGISPRLLNLLLGGYLARIPNRQDGTAYIVDQGGAVVAAREPRVDIGARLGEPGLLKAIASGSSGHFGDDQFFASEPVRDTPWRVVRTAAESRLYGSVSGARKWVPWIIWAAFCATAVAAVVLLQRTLRNQAAAEQASTQLQEANSRLEANNELLRKAAELARSNAELEQFASIASHDLQEPLRKVQTFATQLKTNEQDRLSDEGQDYLRRMSDAAGRMRMLIDDLLMFSRVTSEGRPFAPVDLSEVAEQVVGDLDVAVQESGATVSLGALPTVEADDVQMRQLLQNLIGNAVKFHRPGVPPDVAVEAEVADGHMKLTVADNGIGFEPQYGTRIFRAFERLHSRAAYPGTGIGLALCRKIVERHSGTITAESPGESGATFTVTLPIAQNPDSDAETDAPDAHTFTAAHA
jgi:signal transduction histidine kinase